MFLKIKEDISVEKDDFDDFQIFQEESIDVCV